MTLRNILCAALLCITGTAFAQQPTAYKKYSDVSYKSATIGDDGRVTFWYHNPNARQVFVDVQFAGRVEMHKSPKHGLWYATVGTAAPDMYPYCFIVDGVSIMDPQCEQYFPNEGFKNSLLEIPSRNGSLPHDIKDVPHGRMEYIKYHSRSLQYTNNAIVYLPPSYFTDTTRRYPVFYLISGTTDTEEVYYKVGRVNYILDNLIAEGKARDMIVVLPYGNPNKLLPTAPEQGMPVTGFGNDVFSNDLIHDLMPYVEMHYRTINDRDHRAIGGFSRGGNQGLSNGLHNLDKFSYLCSYSSFTSTDIPEVYDNAADTNSKLHLFWLGVGTDDFLYGNARDYSEFLDQKGIRCVKEYTHDKFGHTWMNAKYFLSRTLPLLFNEQASADAMDNASPTLARTGDEKQFTPGVMARLFPKQIVSPTYSGDDVSFAFRAPEAQSVKLDCELLPEPAAMGKDTAGVWRATVKGLAQTTFKYCYIVDGTRVADPVNMYLSPDHGFKYSISKAQRPDNPLLKHGIVQYDYANNAAIYYAAGVSPDEAPVVTLAPGPDDTVESWVKVGEVADLADRLIAEGTIPPCVIRIAPNATANYERVIRADEYTTWRARAKAVETFLIEKWKDQE